MREGKDQGEGKRHTRERKQAQTSKYLRLYKQSLAVVSKNLQNRRKNKLSTIADYRRKRWKKKQQFFFNKVLDFVDKCNTKKGQLFIFIYYSKITEKL